MIKEALANGRLASGGDPAGTPAQLTALARARDVTVDAIAIAAALANPWASVVLSGDHTGGPAQSPGRTTKTLSVLRSVSSSRSARRDGVGHSGTT